MKTSNNPTSAQASWDRSIRIFHWLNVLLFLGLVALGTVILNAKTLGVSVDGKILLKQIHIWIGYGFTLNLLWRVLWGFVGSDSARWRNILPFSRHYKAELQADLAARRAGRPLQYLGHNPLGRLMISALMALLLVQAGTGLILAGTDMYQGPIGHIVANAVVAEGSDPNSLKPYDKTGVDPQRYEAMRAWRKPIVETHEWLFFILLGLVAVHIAAVVMAELREGGALVSAMISGKKHIDIEPDDDINIP